MTRETDDRFSNSIREIQQTTRNPVIVIIITCFVFGVQLWTGGEDGSDEGAAAAAATTAATAAAGP